MIPSWRLVLLLVPPMVLALLLLADQSFLAPMVMMDAAIVLVAMSDAVLSVRPCIEVVRSSPEVMSLGRANVVRLDVRSTSRRVLSLRLRDDVFDGAKADELPLRLWLPARGRVMTEYRVFPGRRGAYELGDHYVRYPSILGFWTRQLRLPARDAVRVYPDLKQMRTFELLARRDRELTLVRATRHRGGETEFSRLRDYTRDDEYRAIDWKATARRRNLIVREYQLESNQHVLFVLDAGRTMSTEADGLSEFDCALNAMLMLAHVASRTGDQVGLLSFDRDVQAFVRPTGGGVGTGRLIRASYALHPRLVESDYERAFANVMLRQRKRALVILFTRVVDGTGARMLVRHTRLLKRRHLPLIVLFRDAQVERLLEPGDDSERELYTRAAAAELLRWRGMLVGDLRRAGAFVLDTQSGLVTPKLINSYLSIKARHLL